MASRPLAADTPREVEDRQIEAWRCMPTADKAGLRVRYPTASERELFLRLAVLTLGAELAERA